MIPEAHAKIAVQEYGYDLTPEIRREYRRHKTLCVRLALALGYSRPCLDVEGRKVYAYKDGVRHTLANGDDPMNLWLHAWSRLECSLYTETHNPSWGEMAFLRVKGTVLDWMGKR